SCSIHSAILSTVTLGSPFHSFVFFVNYIALMVPPGDLPARPSTAPPTEARARYHQINSANKDLWQYRHSGGICPKDCKMDPSSRMPAPQLTSPSREEARRVYQTNQSEYALNRVRGLISRVDAYA
ncbi:hypothetical protein DUNSADRAFT_5925, partial [Dunaliella salina]